MGGIQTLADPVTDNIKQEENKEKCPCDKYIKFKDCKEENEECPCLSSCLAEDCISKNSCGHSKYIRLLEGDKKTNLTFVEKCYALDLMNLPEEGEGAAEKKIQEQAQEYAAKISSNINFTWSKGFTGGSNLNVSQKANIRKISIKMKLLPNVPILKMSEITFGFPVFDEVSINGKAAVLETIYLPKEKWNISDRRQFAFLNGVSHENAETRGHSTWHHTEHCGKMQLVQRGIHNIITHNGGRTTQMWAQGKR